MKELLKSVNSPLFAGMTIEDRVSALTCTGYRVNTYIRDQVLVFEEDDVKHIGIVLEGYVDMIKEDHWGNKTLLLRLGKDEMFGETFACGEDSLSVVTFVAPYGARVLLIPFHRVMHNCANACAFHQKLIENMVKVIAGKNRELMRKIEVVSKRTIREKLLAYLSLQAQTQDSPYFDIPLGRVELAEYLCVDRSALTRELAEMKEEGILDYDRNSFRLLQ